MKHLKKFNESNLHIGTWKLMANAVPSKETKLLARYMAHHGVRNTELENLHASGKISDEEMRKLMLDIEDKLAKLIQGVFGGLGLNDDAIKLLKKEYKNGISWDRKDFNKKS